MQEPGILININCELLCSQTVIGALTRFADPMYVFADASYERKADRSAVLPLTRSPALPSGVVELRMTTK